MQRAKDGWQKEREEYKAIIDELKAGLLLAQEPEQLRRKQTKQWLEEKNDELTTALVKSERLCDKFRYELKKTSEMLEIESKKLRSVQQAYQKSSAALNVYVTRERKAQE